MGWWRTGNADDVIGDDAADILGLLFQAVADERTGSGKTKPTLDELLGAVGAVLRRDAGALTADGGNRPLGGLVVTIDGATSTIAAQGPAGDLAPRIENAVRDIASAYQESELDRKPRLSEILSSLAFVLGYRPEMYLSGVEGKQITEITAE